MNPHPLAELAALYDMLMRIGWRLAPVWLILFVASVLAAWHDDGRR